MKRHILFLFLFSVPFMLLAQPGMGITDFETETLGPVASSGPSPKTGAIAGWNFSIYSAVNCAITIGQGPSPAVTKNVNLISTPVTTGIWQEGRIASANGSRFRLQELNFHVLTTPFIGLTLIFKGYANGVFVPGATVTSSTIVATNTIMNVNFQANTKFYNIDEIRITPSGTTAQGTVAIEDLTSTAAVVLPVTWNGPPLVAINNGSPLIYWSVATQHNNDRYEVERSYDGQNFSRIGTVAASDKTTYSYNDPGATDGLVFYRIRQVDIDGQFSYSDIASLKLGRRRALTISPNPADNLVRITVSENDVRSAGFFNAAGALVKMISLTAGTTLVNVQDLSAGVYYLKVVNKAGTETSTGFIKN